MIKIECGILFLPCERFARLLDKESRWTSLETHLEVEDMDVTLAAETRNEFATNI
jgi:hypothetical protein